MTGIPRWTILMLAALLPLTGALLGGGHFVQAEPPQKAPDSATGKETGDQLIAQEIDRIVRNIHVSVEEGGARRPLERVKGPLLRFEVPRRFARGTVWAWGSPGRPHAVLSLCVTGPLDEPLWCQEMVSLSTKPVSAASRGSTWWSTQDAGWNPKPIRDAPEPAQGAEERLRQMKTLAARFQGFEYDQPDSPWDVPLLPEPILRYGSPPGDTLDGAIFVFALPVKNPEILLVLEAQKHAPAGAGWSYSAASLSAGGLILKLDGKEVWRRERLVSGTKASDPYYVRFISAKEEFRAEEAEGERR